MPYLGNSRFVLRCFCLKTGNIRYACLRLSSDHLPELFESRRVSALLGCLAHDNIGNSQRVSDDCFSGLLVRANRSSKAIRVIFDGISQFCELFTTLDGALDEVFKGIALLNFLQDCIGDIAKVIRWLS
ncbi:Uncharacterised protein [Enterobacter hormaechei]|nr:Uncharacterised protein [Enterobacter hormaechei]VAF03986.1 Uncharacterised protein [Enterobacter hormaechei]